MRFGQAVSAVKSWSGTLFLLPSPLSPLDPAQTGIYIERVIGKERNVISSDRSIYIYICIERERERKRE